MDALQLNYDTINYTIEDIYALPEGERAELIDGQMYMMSAPTTSHQRILNYLSTEINLYIRSKNGACEVLPSPFAVFLDADDKTYVEPDISVICDKSKIDERGCNGAPDWIIEIVSKSSTKMDYMVKLFKYHSAGVKEYWIVDAAKNWIANYDFAHEMMTVYTFDDTVKAGLYDDLEIDFSPLRNE